MNPKHHLTPRVEIGSKVFTDLKEAKQFNFYTTLEKIFVTMIRKKILEYDIKSKTK